MSRKQFEEQMQESLLVIARILFAMDEIKHSYESFKRSEYVAVYSQVAGMTRLFASFNDDTRENLLQDLNVDSLFDAHEYKGAIERQGRELFSMLATLLDEELYSRRLEIADLATENEAKLHKMCIDCFDAAKKKLMRQRKEKLPITTIRKTQKEAERFQEACRLSEEKHRKAKREVAAKIKEIRAVLHPHLVKGAMYDRFKKKLTP